MVGVECASELWVVCSEVSSFCSVAETSIGETTSDIVSWTDQAELRRVRLAMGDELGILDKDGGE